MIEIADSLFPNFNVNYCEISTKDSEMLTMSASHSNAFMDDNSRPLHPQNSVPGRKTSLDSLFYEECNDANSETMKYEMTSSKQDEILNISDSSTTDSPPQTQILHTMSSPVISESSTATSFNFLNNQDEGIIIENNETSEKSNQCEKCRRQIKERFLFQIEDKSWHENCLMCSSCGCGLKTSCYIRDDKIYCKEDYTRLCKTCGGCNEVILKGAPSMKLPSASNVYFHTQCFKCNSCTQPLKMGDVYICSRTPHQMNALSCEQCWFITRNVSPNHISTSTNENKITKLNIATTREEITTKTSNQTNYLQSPKSTLSAFSLIVKSDDEDNSDDDMEVLDDNMSRKNGDNTSRDSIDEKDLNDESKKSKRPRTILNAVQRRAFKRAFEISPKPCRKVRETLASETGLSVRVVQVWFQNQRAKIKKLAKRQRSHEAAHFKNRGFYSYDPLTPLPHQIPPLMMGQEVRQGQEYVGHNNRTVQHQTIQHHPGGGWCPNPAEMMNFQNQISWNQNFMTNEFTAPQHHHADYSMPQNFQFLKNENEFEAEHKMTPQMHEKALIDNNNYNFPPEPQYFN